ncbi:MAG: histidine kinase [Ignavibacteriales bacterium]|nr:histidine kinase [Ignavibacteriales bacterium]
MLKKFLMLIVIGFIQYLETYPQTPSYYHYTSTDGLASSTVFQIIQDKEGFIWFATQNGVSKFDGKRFTTFRIEDGLNSNMITSLAVGNRGEIYCGNYEKGINVLRNGKMENYFYNSGGKHTYITFMINVPTKKNKNKLYANTRLGYINTIYEKTDNTPLKQTIYLEPLTLIKLEKLLSGGIIVLTTKGLFEIKNDILSKMKIDGYSDAAAFCLAEAGDGSFYIGTKGKIYRIKNNNMIDNYKINVGGNNEVSSIVKDKNNNLWFAVMNRGFFKIPDGTKNIIDIGSKMNLQNTNVNNLFEDNEGNIWAGTYGKGVYCLNNFYLSTYNENDGLSNNSIQSVVKEKSGKLFIGTYNGVNILDNGRFVQKKVDAESMLTEYIHNIKIFNDGIYISGGFPKLDRERIPYKGLNLFFISRPCFIRTSNGLNILGTTGNHIRVHRDFFADRYAFQVINIFGDSPSENRINELLEDTNKNIWVGSTLGLCKLSNFTETSGKVKWDKTFFPSNPILNSRIKSIFQDKKNNVWFAGDLGIAKYNLQNNSVTEYKSIDGYDLASSTSIASDNKGRIWIGNMKGLYLFDGSSTKYLSSKTGLPTDEVLSLYHDEEKNFLYVGTSNGISFLDINLFDRFHPQPPDLKMISIEAGDSVYTSYGNLVFEPEQNNVYIEFTASNFSSSGSVKYKYKLNNEWIETDHNFLNFTSLKNGTYNIAVLAKAQNTGWSKPYAITFKILPRFVETIWFVLIIFTVLILISLSIFLWRMRLLSKKNRDKIELTERINDLKHQALSSMMNPHFIFNSLNSVQYLINHQRNEEANDYIAMMAKLIRKNLDTAGSGFILLSEEINRLKLYLDLEKLRFQEKFSYEIVAGTDVNIDSIMIPNMIIQPFVENSLWHGIINSGKHGILSVSFSFEEVEIDSIFCKSLIIKITDNGIGINEAAKNKKVDHISKGIQIIEERLRLLSTKMELPKPIILEDLNRRNLNAHGTEAIISLPPPLYKTS